MFCPFIVDESPQRGQTSIKHPVWLCSNSPFWMVKSNFERLHFMYLRSLGPHIERSADKNPEATAAGFLLWANSTLEVAVTSQFSSWIPLSRDFFSGTDWMNLYEFQECRLAHGEFIGCLLAVRVCWRVIMGNIHVYTQCSRYFSKTIWQKQHPEARRSPINDDVKSEEPGEPGARVWNSNSYDIGLTYISEN